MPESTQPQKIICIEDEPEMVELVQIVLSRRGFDVTGATGGAEGLQKMRANRPDLVLLDLMMPGMDGWEVYQQMKADEKLKNVPVIIVTAKAQSIDRILAEQVAKVDYYITKPFGPRELVEVVERLLNKAG
jgi:DNA-binding response OmpR family regulator